MKLYTHPLSPNARRAELGLAEYGLPYERVVVNLAGGEQRTDAFLAKNPNGKVPVLEDGDLVLPESNAILFYLAAIHPERRLEGRTVGEKGEVLRWVFFNTAHMSPAGAQIFQHTKLLPEPKRVPQLVEGGRAELARCLGIADADLAKRPWMAGESFSLADVAVAPNVWFARSVLDVSFEPYPHVIRWLRAVQSRPSWELVYNS